MAASGGRPGSLAERVAVLEQKTGAAHQRIDKVEVVIKEELKEINMSLKDVVAWMNRGKGWAAAGLLLAGSMGVVGSLVFKLLSKA